MAKRKYEHIIDKLPPRPLEENPGRQEKLDAIKAKMEADPDFKHSAAFIADQYADIRAEKDAIDDVLSEVQLRLDATVQLLIAQYEAEGVRSVHLESGEAPRVETLPYAKVVDPEAFRLWCLKEGLERKMSLHPSTTQSLAKDRFLAGEPDPPPGIELSRWTKVVLG